MKFFNKKSLCIKKIVLFTLLTFTVSIKPFFGINSFFRENWKKISITSVLGIIGSKVLLGKANHDCSHCYYKKTNSSLLGKANRGLNTVISLSTKAAFLLGALYVYNKFFPNQRILNRITEAKDTITNHVTDKVLQATDYLHNKIGNLKNHISHRFDKTDGKLDTIQGTATDTQEIISRINSKINDIQKTTQDTNNMVKEVQVQPNIRVEKSENRPWFLRLF